MTRHGLALVALAGLWAGAQNALAGGGSFVTFPALLLAGLDARAANITSTIALFPGQVAAGWAGRRRAAGTADLPFRLLVAISLAGGMAGALLLLATPAGFFARLVPWLILFATAVFAYGSFRAAPGAGPARLGRPGAVAAQAAISVYGGYFGGGIGFLMLATLTLAGMALQRAAPTKNVLAAAMNASAVLVFLFSPQVAWPQAAVLAAASIAGGALGARLLARLDDRVLRVIVVCIGLALTAAMFWRLG